MVSPRRAEARRRTPGTAGGLKAPGFVLLALAGTWVAHTLEYLRVWGTEGLAARLTAPLHLWMIPVGGVLLLVAAAGGVRWVRLHRALGEQVELARVALARRMRNLPAPPRPAPPRRAVPAGTHPGRAPLAFGISFSARLITLWASLTAAIGAVYLLQENIEAAAASHSLPGLAPLTGLHAAAPLVIAAAAFALAACAVEGRRRAAAATAGVDALERLFRALDALRRTGSAPPARYAHPQGGDLERLGAQLWRRPPPAVIAAP
jgi:hypothetical protein